MKLNKWFICEKNIFFEPLTIHFGQSFRFDHAHHACLSNEETFYTRIKLLHERPHRDGEKCVQYYLLVLKINSILWIVGSAAKWKHLHVGTKTNTTDEIRSNAKAKIRATKKCVQYFNKRKSREASNTQRKHSISAEKSMLDRSNERKNRLSIVQYMLDFNPRKKRN